MKKCKIILLSICSILILWNIFQVYRSYYGLHNINYSLSSEKLSDTIRFVTLSDQHDHLFGEDNALLKEKVLKYNPDLLFLDGDMVNEDSEDCDELCAFIEDMTAYMPVYVALGNHEISYMKEHPELIVQLTDAGATVLDKAYVDIEVKDQKLRVGGLYDYAFSLQDLDMTDPSNEKVQIYNFLNEFQDTDAFKIMLSHRPDSFIFGDASKVWNIDLVICGHLHGGQIILPFLGGVYGGDQGCFPKYVHGMYKKDEMHILITSGLSTNRKAIPRWNNPPEIMELELFSN